VTWACSGLRDEPVATQGDGYHFVKKSYDERGNRIALEYYGVDGKRCLVKYGYAKMTADYDERGNRVEEAYFGLRDEPAINQSHGAHRVKTSYDERGNCIAWENYGVDGQRCLVKDGYAKMTADYDERGNQVKGASFGLRDEPVVTQSNGNHSAKKSYDERGNCITWEFYGVDGKRCLVKDGYAKGTADYDHRGKQIRLAYFGLRDEPVINQSDGTHTVRNSYDGRGNCILWEYYGVDGQRCLTKDGYAKKTANYDDVGHQLEQVEFDLTGKSTVQKYNQRGWQIEEAYLDETGSSTANKNGVTRWTVKYDEDANVTDMTYFDRDGKPIAVQIYLVEVLPDGQAEKAGLVDGDVLVSYDGKMVTNDAEIWAWIHSPGDTLRELIVSRSGRYLSFKMKPGLMGVRTSARAASAPAGTDNN
jgi:hypothetical protein